MTFQLNFKQDGEVLYGSNLMENLAFVANIGMNFALDGATTTNQDNLKVDLFGSDTATTLSFMEYDAGADYYNCVDMTATYYVVVTASASSASSAGNVIVQQIATGKWAVYAKAGTFEVNRANVMDYLFTPSTKTDATTAKIISGFTTVTAIQSSDSRDIGKKASWGYNSGSISASGGQDYVWYQGTPAAGGNDCSIWGYTSHSGSGSSHSSAVTMDGTVVSVGGAGGTDSSFNTDGSADERNNPSVINMYTGESSSNTASGTQYCLVLHESTIAWADNSSGAGASVGTQYDYDYTVDGSIPLFTDIGSDDLTCYFVTNSTTITTNETVVIVKSLNSITPGNTLTTAVSFNGGSNYTTVTEKELATIANTGTSFLIKFTIVRALNTDTDYVTSYAAYYG
jgi:hypothetical protein